MMSGPADEACKKTIRARSRKSIRIADFLLDTDHVRSRIVGKMLVQEANRLVEDASRDARFTKAVRRRVGHDFGKHQATDGTPQRPLFVHGMDILTRRRFILTCVRLF